MTTRTSSISSTLGVVLRACIYLYSLSLIVYGILRIVTGETLDIISIVDNLMPCLLLPAFVLLPISLLIRHRNLVFMLLPAVIAFVLLYGRLFIPPAAAQGKPDLTIMTYNVNGGNHDFDAIAQAIRDSGADVVLLQEVSEGIRRKLPTSLVNDHTYAFSSLHPSPNSRLGLGVYSRYPLLVDDYSAYQLESSRLRIQIKLKGVLVTIYNVHLTNPLVSDIGFGPQSHHESTSALLDMLAGEQNPLVVAGDFNMTDVSADYGRIATHLLDSYRESGYGFGFTFPSWSPVPLVRPDYVFYSSDLHSVRTQVGASSANSDHFPVIAQLNF